VTVTLLQTSDLHHRATGYGPQLDYTPDDTTDNDTVKGGYARLAGLIKGIRGTQSEKDIPVVLVDSGDFTMGTVYDLTFSDPIAFRFFEDLEYDAVTLGNHEFDWGPQRLADMIAAARDSGFATPIVTSNMVFSDTATEDDDLAAFSGHAIVAHTVIEPVSGLKIGLLGLMGEDAAAVAPNADPVTFGIDYAAIQAQVDDLRDNQGVQVVIVLSHSGVIADGTGEDDDLARAVTGIDIIASGHEHTATTDIFETDNGTLIFSPGGYGAWLSRLDFVYDKKQGRLTDYSFELIPVDDAVEGDAATQVMVEAYDSTIADLLSDVALRPETILSKTAFDLNPISLTESALGNLCADAVRAAGTTFAVDGSSAPFHIGVVANGLVRGALTPGDSGLITFSDTYSVLPLGHSPDTTQLPGYPMISVYVAAPDIINICEVTISAAKILGNDFYLNFSGMRIDYDPDAPPFQTVTDVYLCDTDDLTCSGTVTALDRTDSTTLYRLAVNLYLLELMDYATALGIAIVPKDADGNVITPEAFMDHRIDMSTEEGIQELKEWYALQHYLSTYFPAAGEGLTGAVYGTDGTAMGRLSPTN
jgi:5'-nucleotidase